MSLPYTSPLTPCSTQTKASSFLRHTCPHTTSTARMEQVVRWCFELLMKLASVPGSRGEGERRGKGREVGGLLSETQAASHLGPKARPLRVLLLPAKPSLSRHWCTNGSRNFNDAVQPEAWICSWDCFFGGKSHVRWLNVLLMTHRNTKEKIILGVHSAEEEKSENWWEKIQYRNTDVQRVAFNILRKIRRSRRIDLWLSNKLVEKVGPLCPPYINYHLCLCLV